MPAVNGHRAQVDDGPDARPGRRPRHGRRALRDEPAVARARVHDGVAAGERAREPVLVERIGDATVEPESQH